jgi:hypothetical protein
MDQIPKKARALIKAAKQHGATIENGSKHLKVYDGHELVGVFHRGGKSGYEGRHDMANVKKVWRARGWIE